MSTPCMENSTLVVRKRHEQRLLGVVGGSVFEVQFSNII
jgi:hypothetical protein